MACLMNWLGFTAREQMRLTRQNIVYDEEFAESKWLNLTGEAFRLYDATSQHSTLFPKDALLKDIYSAKALRLLAAQPESPVIIEEEAVQFVPASHRGGVYAQQGFGRFEISCATGVVVEFFSSALIELREPQKKRKSVLMA